MCSIKIHSSIHTANCFLIAFRYKKNNINVLFLSEFLAFFFVFWLFSQLTITSHVFDTRWRVSLVTSLRASIITSSPRIFKKSEFYIVKKKRARKIFLNVITSVCLQGNDTILQYNIYHHNLKWMSKADRFLSWNVFFSFFCASFVHASFFIPACRCFRPSFSYEENRYSAVNSETNL